ncbi:MAG: hypothetical protein WCE75_00280, partial [Terracidiphilus sp.]
MDGSLLIALILLAIVGAPVAILVLLARARGDVRELHEQVANLNDRLRDLEWKANRPSAAAPQNQPLPAEPPPVQQPAQA